MRLLIVFAALLIGSVSSTLAKECRMPDHPPGSEVRSLPSCKDLARGRSEAERQGSLRGNQGFIDLGNGTQVRINGRVRAEFGVRR